MVVFTRENRGGSAQHSTKKEEVAVSTLEEEEERYTRPLPSSAKHVFKET